MVRPQRWIVAILIVGGLVLPACTSGSGGDAGGDPVSSVEPIDGTDVARVTLSADAARRLDIHTAAVEEASGQRGGNPRTRIPYAAVLYDASGHAWTYTSPEPLVFIRSPIRIERIEGSRAVLSSGPPLGTQVVTVGAAELLGTEYEVGEE